MKYEKQSVINKRVNNLENGFSLGISGRPRATNTPAVVINSSDNHWLFRERASKVQKSLTVHCCARFGSPSSTSVSHPRRILSSRELLPGSVLIRPTASLSAPLLIGILLFILSFYPQRRCHRYFLLFFSFLFSFFDDDMNVFVIADDFNFRFLIN